MKAYLVAFFACAVIFSWGFATLKSAMDLPTVEKNHLTKECVRVLATEGERPCSSIKEGDKYSTVWVAG